MCRASVRSIRSCLRFSAKSLFERIEDARAKWYYCRRGHARRQAVALKRAVTKPWQCGDTSCVERVIVYRRPVARSTGTHATCGGTNSTQTQAATSVPGGSGLSIRSSSSTTSGSTGKPRALQHSTGGYLLGAMLCDCSGYSMQPGFRCCLLSALRRPVDHRP